MNNLLIIRVRCAFTRLSMKTDERYYLYTLLMITDESTTTRPRIDFDMK